MHTQIPAESLLGLPHWNSVRTTKIFAPRLSATTIARKRLIDRLNLYKQYAVTLVVAPAGFGKTTLMAQWREQADVRSAWLTLDGHEKTVAQFVSSVTAALMEALPEYREEWEKIYTALGSDEQASVAFIMQALIDAAAAIPDDFTLIIDDYHNVESYEVHAFLNRLIDHLPASMHLLIGSRTTPPMQISRLRVQGLLRELRAPQLKFLPEEGQQFLNDAMGLRLTDEQIEQLESRTEGWVAGLQLAALSLQEAGDVDALVNSFSGTNPYVLGYLADEVLNRQPERLQEFLLQTSILDRLSAEVCDYVTESDNGRETLQRLEQMNLFIVALDERPEWYRYHRLFADLLRLRLGQRYGEEEVRRLHRRAGEWYLANGCIELGVEHALQAREWNIVRRIVEPAGLPMVLEFKSIRKWLMELPEEELRTSPALATWAGWAILMLGRFKDAARIANIATQSAATSSNTEADAYILTLKARIGALNGDGRNSLPLALAAVEKVSLADHPHRAAAFYSLGMAYDASGLPSLAEEAFDEARHQVGYMKSLSNTMMVLTVAYRARAILHQGRLNDALVVIDEAASLAVEFALSATTYTSFIRGEMMLQAYHLEAARDILVESLNLGRRRNFHINAPDARVLLTWVYCALGNAGDALSILREQRQWSVDNGNERLMLDAEAGYMHYRLAEGNLAEVSLWVDRSCALDTDPVIPYERELEYGVCSRLLIARGFKQDDRALVDRGIRLLERLRDAALKSSRRLDVMSAEASIAIALAQLWGDDYLAPLEEALRIAVKQHAYFPLFLDGDRMWWLLDRTAQRGHLTELIDAVRSDCRKSRHTDTHTKAGMTEPLSDREYDVLNLLASGLSTREIADSLFVSTNTVKTHTRHIYDKLNAHNRTYAITRARELGLLD